MSDKIKDILGKVNQDSQNKGVKNTATNTSSKISKVLANLSDEEIQKIVEEKLDYISWLIRYSKANNLKLIPSPKGLKTFACGLDDSCNEIFKKYMSGKIKFHEIPKDTFRPSILYYDLDMLLQSDTKSLGALSDHEIGHAEFSDYSDIFYLNKLAKDLGLPVSLVSLFFNGANEDPFIGRKISKKGPIKKAGVEHLYKNIGAKQVDGEIILRRTSKVKQLETKIAYYWLNKDFPNTYNVKLQVDEDVEKIFTEQILPNFDKMISSDISNIERTIFKNSILFPILQDLCKKDIETAKQMQKIKENMKKQKGSSDSYSQEGQEGQSGEEGMSGEKGDEGESGNKKSKNDNGEGKNDGDKEKGTNGEGKETSETKNNEENGEGNEEENKDAKGGKNEKEEKENDGTNDGDKEKGTNGEGKEDDKNGKGEKQDKGDKDGKEELKSGKKTSEEKEGKNGDKNSKDGKNNGEEENDGEGNKGEDGKENEDLTEEEIDKMLEELKNDPKKLEDALQKAAEEIDKMSDKEKEELERNVKKQIDKENLDELNKEMPSVEWSENEDGELEFKPKSVDKEAQKEAEKFEKKLEEAIKNQKEEIDKTDELKKKINDTKNEDDLDEIENILQKIKSEKLKDSVKKQIQAKKEQLEQERKRKLQNMIEQGFSSGEENYYNKFIELENKIEPYVDDFIVALTSYIPKLRDYIYEGNYHTGVVYDIPKAGRKIRMGHYDVYGRKEEIETMKINLGISISIDVSGSMTNNNKMQESLKLMIFLGIFCEKLKIPFYINTIGNSPKEIKLVQDEYYKSKGRIMEITKNPNESTYMQETFKQVQEVMLDQKFENPELEFIPIIITDGDPSDGSSELKKIIDKFDGLDVIMGLCLSQQEKITLSSYFKKGKKIFLDNSAEILDKGKTQLIDYLVDNKDRIFKIETM